MKTKPNWTEEITRDDLIMVGNILKAFGNAQPTNDNEYWWALGDACNNVAQNEHQAKLCTTIMYGLYRKKELEEEKNEQTGNCR